MDPASSRKPVILLAQASLGIPPMPTGSPFPKTVPDDWIKAVETILNDPCFCIAVMSVLLEFAKESGIEILDPGRIKKFFLETVKTAKHPEWGPKEGLKDGKGVKLNGLFQAYEDPQLDVILLERELYDAHGDKSHRDVYTQSNKLITFLHEALHKFIYEIETRNKLIKIQRISEESLITRILLRYFIHPLHQVLPLELTNNITNEIKKIEAGCKSMGHCDKDRPQKTGDENMSPPLVPPVPHGADYNNDGIPDSYVESNVCKTVRFADHVEVYDEVGSKTPILRGPPPNWIGFRLDEYKECPVEAKTGAKVWQLRYVGRFDPYEFPFTRFYNSKKTMSFAPGEKAVIPDVKGPQEIQSILLYLDEKTGNLTAPVYVQFQGCLIVPLDDLSFVTEQAERLDMERVKEMVVGKAMPDSSPSEQEAAKILRGILADHSFAIERARELPEAKQDEMLLDLRNKILPQIHGVTKGVISFPASWEEGALTILGLPPKDFLQSPCLKGPTCCQAEGE